MHRHQRAGAERDLAEFLAADQHIKPAADLDQHLVPLHPECPTYVLRRDGLHLVEEPVQVCVGDMVVAGTTVIGLRAPE